jgi:glycosyltransferase involved in cell wall biosynthesis
VIATRVSVLPSLLGDGAGVLLDEAHPHHVARAVERILADAATYEQMSLKALATARAYSLESWRDTIGVHLSRAWGPLKSGGANSIAAVGR